MCKCAPLVMGYVFETTTGKNVHECVKVRLYIDDNMCNVNGNGVKP